MARYHNPKINTNKNLSLVLDAANPKSYTGVTTSVTTTIEDPYADNVSLLLNGNGTNGSTTFTDSSSYGHTVTPVGDAQISTAQIKFGVSSMYFDGNGDYLTATDSSFAFGTGEFTVEFWMRVASTATSEALLSVGNVSTFNSWQISGGTDLEFVNQNGQVAGGTFPTLDTWHHVAVVRDSSNVATLYINGTNVDSAEDTFNYSADNLRIGVNRNVSHYYHGYIDDLRITKGVARYTSNFTPPAAELYLSTTETQQAPVLTDISLNNNAATLYNGVGYTSSNVGYFTFDGTNNYMEIPYDESVNITDGDFTIDFWMNSFSDQTSDVLVSYGNTSNVGGWAIKTATNKLQYSVGFATHPAVAGIVTSGLVVHLDAGDSASYSGIGTTWTDLSGNGNDGTINGATYDSANGGSLSFDGSNDYVSNVDPGLSDVQAEGELTYEYWIQPTQAIYASFTQSTSGYQYYAPGTQQGLANNAEYKHGNQTYAAFLFAFGTNGFVATAHNNNYAPPFLVDYNSYTGISHLTVIKSVYGCSYYINGVFKKSSATQSKILGVVPDRVTSNESTYFGRYFKGNIYSYRFYNRALTASEIQRNYDALKGRYTSQLSPLDPLDTFGIAENADFSSGITTNTWNHYALIRSGNVYTPYINAVPGTSSYVYGADSNMDLYFDNASIILNANGDNGSTSIIDSSPNNHTGIITAYNGAGISTSEYKFGGSSLYFDGTNHYIDCGTDPSYAMEDEDFTIEFWMYTDQANSGNYLFRIGPQTSPDGSLAVYANTASGGSGNITFERSRGGGNSANGAGITIGQWNHIAWTRSGSNFYFFVNGTNTAVTSVSRNPYNEGNLTLGAQYYTSSGTRYYHRHFNGYIDDFIITKGVAKYTSDFTPPNQASYYSNDPNYDNLSILLQGNGQNLSTSIIDSSPNNHTGIITAYNGAGISTSEYKFGGSSLYFDGTDDYIDCGASDAYSFGTGDFMIEFWHYIVDSNQTWYSSDKIFSTINLNNTPGISLSVYGNPSNFIQFYWRYSVGNSSTSFNLAKSAPVGEWYHVAWGRKNGASLFFVNGKKEFDITQTYTQADYTNNTLVLGKDLEYQNNYMGESYIDDFRITKGVAKYTEDFIPPDRTKIQNNEASLKFGASGTNNSNPFNGALSNLKIYKDSLTQSEITQNYNAHKSRYGL